MTVGSPQEERGKSEAAADVRGVIRAANRLIREAGQTGSGRCALQPWREAPAAARTGGPALRLAGLRPVARSTCTLRPGIGRHRDAQRVTA